MDACKQCQRPIEVNNKGKKYCDEDCRELFLSTQRTLRKQALKEPTESMEEELATAMAAMSSRLELLWRCLDEDGKILLSRIVDRYPVNLPSLYKLVRVDQAIDIEAREVQLIGGNDDDSEYEQ